MLSSTARKIQTQKVLFLLNRHETLPSKCARNSPGTNNNHDETIHDLTSIPTPVPFLTIRHTEKRPDK